MFLLVLIQKCVYLVCLCPQMLQEVVAKTLKHHGITAEHDCFEACSKRLFDISKFYLKVCLFTALSESVLCFCLTLSLFVLLYDSRTFVLFCILLTMPATGTFKKSLFSHYSLFNFFVLPCVS